jgi:hypothetical protein
MSYCVTAALLALPAQAALAAQYASAAGACGVQHSEAALHVLHECVDTVEAAKRELAPGRGDTLWGGDALAVDIHPGTVGPTAGAISAKSAALPLRSQHGRAQIDAQLAQLASDEHAQEETHMPFIPGMS